MDRELSRSTRRRQALRRWVTPLAALLVAVLLFVWLTGLLRPSIDRSRIRTSHVERGPIEAVLTADGTVQPASEQVLSSPIDGRVMRVLRRPGALLDVGDAVLELDRSTTELGVERLEGEITQAEARRRELEAQLDEMLNEKTGERQIKTLDLEELTYEEEQRQELFEQGLVSESILRSSSARLEKAQIQLQMIEQSTINARRALEAQIGVLDADLGIQKRELAVARRQLERATTAANRVGVLTWVFDEEGATVREGDVLARIADLDRFRVEARLSDIHASRVRLGQRARVVVEDRSIDARVDRIFPSVESGVLRFWLTLDEGPHEGLRANLRVDALVVTTSVDDALTIAKGPAVNGGGVQQLFVLEGARAVRRTVTIGFSSWDRWQVESGLEEGDEVVISDMNEFTHLKELPVR